MNIEMIFAAFVGMFLAIKVEKLLCYAWRKFSAWFKNYFGEL